MRPGLHRLRMMVADSPGGGYDLTARTAIEVIEDSDITGRVEVFNVIGAGGTVAMARLMNEKGNGDLMMMMGLGVVGAVYTNGSSALATNATALAKMVEEQEGILVPADSPFRRSPTSSRHGRPIPPRSPSAADPRLAVPTTCSRWNRRAAGVDPTKVDYISYDGGGDLLTALLGKKIAGWGPRVSANTSTRSKPARSKSWPSRRRAGRGIDARR